MTNNHTRPAIEVANLRRSYGKQVVLDGRSLVRWLYNPWSPDSKHVLFESLRTGHFDLYIATVDSATPRQLTHDVRNDYAGRWSSDGKYVAFISDRGRQTDVWVAPVDGGPVVAHRRAIVGPHLGLARRAAQQVGEPSAAAAIAVAVRRGGRGRSL